jgi:hypothetical protein
VKTLLRRLRGCTGAVLFVAVLAPSTPVARAEPAATPAVGWSQLGLTDSIELIGSNQPIDIDLTVPDGISPAILSGLIDAGGISAPGVIDIVDARGALLDSVPIPQSAAQVPFSADISAADVTAGVAGLTFTIRDIATGTDTCASSAAVALSRLATSYSGPPPNPRTLADFLPRFLDRITIRLGPDPSRDAQQAALALVSDLTQLYRPMPVRIDVDTSRDPVPAADTGTSRTIVIREGGQSGLILENPGSAATVLTVSGTGPELLRQVDLFTDRRFELAQTASATVTSAQQTAPRSAETLSFAELGMTTEAKVIGTSTLYIGFDAAAFGIGSIDHAKFRLVANYTPVTHADASVLVRSGSVILASQVLDQSGVIDLSAELPAGAVTSNIGLALEVRYIPQQTCPPIHDRMTFSVNPESTVTVRAGINNRGGFPVLPMAFTPEFEVAVQSPDQIRFAAQLVNLMAQQSTVAMRPIVTTLDDAAQHRSGLLVVATGDQLGRAGMRPPLSMTDADTVDISGTPITGIDLDGPLGVIQAFRQNDRIVLAVNTTGGDDLADRGLEYIRGLQSRWASLSGDVVATGAAGDTVNLTVQSGGWIADPASAKPGWKQWAWFTLAVGVIGAAAVGLVLILRRRRGKR